MILFIFKCKTLLGDWETEETSKLTLEQVPQYLTNPAHTNIEYIGFQEIDFVNFEDLEEVQRERDELQEQVDDLQSKLDDIESLANDILDYCDY